MAQNSKIEWTEHTHNPWWGCFKVSEGCTHCYAESFSKRVGFRIWGQDAERRYFGDKHWSEPVKWNARAEKLGVMHRVFCGSMCDILEDRPGLEDPRLTVFDLADATKNLLWLFLTKRPQNAAKMFPPRWSGSGNWPRNVMLGVTIENQTRLDERMPHVIEFQRIFPGSMIFASCEPLLSSLDWTPPERRGGHFNPNEWLEYLDWIVAGGESGHGARPCHPDWARKLRDDCRNRDDMCRPWPLPFLWKQWGDWQDGSEFSDRAKIVLNDGRVGKYAEDFPQETRNAWPHYRPTMMLAVGKKAAGRVLDGREWNGVPRLTYGPQVPAAVAGSQEGK